MVQRILSADSHVLEPPDLWTTRMQPRFRDRAPHLEHEFNGQTGDFLVCEPLRPFNPTSLGCAGIPPEELEKFSQRRLRGVPARQLGPRRAAEGHGLRRPRRRDLLLRLRHVAVQPSRRGVPARRPPRLQRLGRRVRLARPEAAVPGRQHLDDRSRAEDLSELHRIKKLGFRGIFISNDPLPERRYDNPMWDTFWTRRRGVRPAGQRPHPDPPGRSASRREPDRRRRRRCPCRPFGPSPR